MENKNPILTTTYITYIGNGEFQKHLLTKDPETNIVTTLIEKYTPHTNEVFNLKQELVHTHESTMSAIQRLIESEVKIVMQKCEGIIYHKANITRNKAIILNIEEALKTEKSGIEIEELQRRRNEANAEIENSKKSINELTN